MEDEWQFCEQGGGSLLSGGWAGVEERKERWAGEREKEWRERERGEREMATHLLNIRKVP